MSELKKMKCARIVLLKVFDGEIIVEGWRSGVVINPTEEDFERWQKEVQQRIEDARRKEYPCSKE